MAIWIM